MNNLILLLLSTTLALMACNAGKKAKDDQPAYGAESMIEMSTGPCYGKCPVFDFTIDGTGKATYHGKRFTDKIGHFVMQMSPEATQALFAAYEAANFWEFEDAYVADITDLPTTWLTFKHDEKSKKIRCYYGVPEKLVELIQLTNTMANTEGWTVVED